LGISAVVVAAGRQEEVRRVGREGGQTTVGLVHGTHGLVQGHGLVHGLVHGFMHGLVNWGCVYFLVGAIYGLFFPGGAGGD